VLWFCFVLLTTVGYGNTYTPSNPGSRFFTLLWSLYGLFIFGAGSSIIQTCIRHVAERVSNAWKRMRPTSKTEVAAESAFTPSDAYFVGKGLFVNYVCFCLLNIIGSLIFWVAEGQGANGGMTLLDAFYHCIMTATTIGLGDIAPQSQAGRAYGIIHMLLSVTRVGSLRGTIRAARERRTQALTKAEMLRKELDEDLIAQLDRNGDGVDQTEFVLGMLETLGVISKEDYEPFLTQFAEMDKDKSGRLTKDDLILLAQSKREKAAQALAEAKANSTTHWPSKLEGHARDLLLPAFLGCFAFMALSTYGVILMVSGVLNVCVIGTVLGSAPSTKKYETVFSLAVNAAIAQLVAVGWLLVFLTSPSSYLENLDPIAAMQLGTSLNDNGYITLMNQTERNAILDLLDSNPEATTTSTQGYVMTALYLFCFLFGIAQDVMAAVCSYNARKELQAGSGSINRVTPHPE